jgi:hypothetical protein
VSGIGLKQRAVLTTIDFRDRRFYSIRMSVPVTGYCEIPDDLQGVLAAAEGSQFFYRSGDGKAAKQWRV